MEPLIQDEKYIVFKRDEFYEMLHDVASSDAPPTDVQMHEQAERVSLQDAVVIRRQDKFASTALATYATTIAMVSQTTPDEVLAKRLTNVADYFQQQSEAAAEQGWKFPD